MPTKAFIEEYKGSPLVVIKEVDGDGKPLRCFDGRTGEEKDRVVVKFGVKKAKAIYSNAEFIEDFVQEHG